MRLVTPKRESKKKNACSMCGGAVRMHVARLASCRFVLLRQRTALESKLRRVRRVYWRVRWTHATGPRSTSFTDTGGGGGYSPRRHAYRFARDVHLDYMVEAAVDGARAGREYAERERGAR